MHISLACTAHVTGIIVRRRKKGNQKCLYWSSSSKPTSSITIPAILIACQQSLSRQPPSTHLQRIKPANAACVAFGEEVVSNILRPVGISSNVVARSRHARGTC